MNSTNNNQTKTKEKQSFFRSNPVLNRLNKVEERAGYNEKAAGYGRRAFSLSSPRSSPRSQDRLSPLPALFTPSVRAS